MACRCQGISHNQWTCLTEHTGWSQKEKRDTRHGCPFKAACLSVSWARTGCSEHSILQETRKGFQSWFCFYSIMKTIIIHSSRQRAIKILPSSCAGFLQSFFWTTTILSLSLTAFQNSSDWLQWHLLLANLFYLDMRHSWSNFTGNLKTNWAWFWDAITPEHQISFLDWVWTGSQHSAPVSLGLAPGYRTGSIYPLRKQLKSFLFYSFHRPPSGNRMPMSKYKPPPD